jgi:transcription elongation factor Elf1
MSQRKIFCPKCGGITKLSSEISEDRHTNQMLYAVQCAECEQSIQVNDDWAYNQEGVITILYE